MSEITLDINKSGQIINEPVVLRVGETNSNLTVHIIKDGQPYKSITSATFNAEKPNSSIVANDPANISGDTLTYTFPKSLNNESGKITNAYFLINGNISTESFIIAVLPGLPVTGEKTIDDYIPGMGELSEIYDQWKDQLASIKRELAGIDAPVEVRNVIDNELKKYTDKLTELNNKIDKAGNDFNSKVDSATKDFNDNIDESNKALQDNIDTTNGRITQLNTDVGNLKVPEFGGRNYILNSGEPIVITGTGVPNQTRSSSSIFSKGVLSNFVNVDENVTIQFDWKFTGDENSGFFIYMWKNSPWGRGFKEINISDDSKEGHFQTVIKIDTAMLENGNDSLSLRLDNVTGVLTISNVSFTRGNVATDWSPAPEDKANVSDVPGLLKGKTLSLADSTGKATTYTITGIS